MLTQSPSETAELKAALHGAGTTRREFKRLRREAAAQLRELIPAAHEAGLTISEIGRLADLTRQSVYAILKQAGR